jgi:hypothetical protein
MIILNLYAALHYSTLLTVPDTSLSNYLFNVANTFTSYKTSLTLLFPVTLPHQQPSTYKMSNPNFEIFINVLLVLANVVVGLFC